MSENNVNMKKPVMTYNLLVCAFVAAALCSYGSFQIERKCPFWLRHSTILAIRNIPSV